MLVDAKLILLTTLPFTLETTAEAPLPEVSALSKSTWSPTL